MKICKDCNQEKPLNEFPKGNNMKSGYRNECKKCSAEYQAAYRIQNLEKFKAYKKQYNLENFDKLRENQRLYNLKNRESINARQAKYVKENPEKFKAYQVRYKARLALNYITEDSKICPCCNDEKPIFRFYKNSKFASGHSTLCKTCLKNLEKI